MISTLDFLWTFPLERISGPKGVLQIWGGGEGGGTPDLGGTPDFKRQGGANGDIN